MRYIVTLLVTLTSFCVVTPSFGTEFDDDTPAEKPVATTTINNTYITYVKKVVRGKTVLIERRMPLPSGPATWGKSEVDRALDEDRLVGRKPITTSASREWKSFATREELATAMNTTYDQSVGASKAYTDQEIGQLRSENNAEHNRVWGAINGLRDRVGLLELVLIILAIWLLARLFDWLRNRNNAGAAAAVAGGGAGAPAGVAQPAQQVPVATTGVYYAPRPQ